jgi:osmotically-inducible protein OsmY
MERDYDRWEGNRDSPEWEQNTRRWERDQDMGMSRNPGHKPWRESGAQYGRQFRSSDRMNDQMNRGRTYGREYDARYTEGYDRYGMRNDDWRHMDDYWRDMYRDVYPREGQQGMTSSENRPNYAGRGPRNYKRSDERIQEDLNEQLTQHHMIDATDIEVSVHEGEITLRGTVESRQAKRMAEDIADSIFGAKDVKNELRVQQRPPREERVA